MGENADLKGEMFRVLKRHWRTCDFRPFQKEAVIATLSGRDVLLILPTGGGKSLTYMLPAVISRKVAVVVSPLLSLAKDQVDAANDQYDIEAASWSSAVSESKKVQIIRDLMSDDGSLRLLYTTPESLQTPRLIEVLSAAHCAGRLCSLAVDEAHCISSWGHDFRESYLQIGSFRDHLPGLPCIAVTATATPDVQASIKTNLKLRSDAAVLIGSFNRRNIALTVKHKELIGDGSQEAVTQEILDLIETKDGEKGIIYCRLRATCDELATALLGADVDVAAYHAGLDQQHRSRVQNDFKEGSLNAIVATVGFGMGVDIPDVRWVVHVDPPATIEGMYQELGRAGRDGHPAVHVLFCSDSDLRQASKMERGPKCGATAAVAAYVQSACCRRQSLLAHFGERRGVCSSNDKDEELCDFCLDAGGVRKRLVQVEEKLAAAQALANPSAGAATLPERSTIKMSFAGQSRRESTKRPKFLLATACEQPEAGNSEHEMHNVAPKENSAPDFVLGIKRQRQFVVPRRLKDEV